VKAVNDFGDTLLHRPCWFGHQICVKELLAHGAGAATKNKNGKTLLDMAQERKNQSTADLLMEHKKCMEQSNMEDAEKPIVLSEVNTLNAQVPERVMTSSLEKEGYSRGFLIIW
jgi:ankyrin repeat protein